MRACRLWSRRVWPASVAWGFGGLPRRCSRVWVVLVALGSLALAGMAAAAGASASTGGVYAWGNNNAAQLGNGIANGPQACGAYEYCSPTPAPVHLGSFITATAIAAGGDHSLALTSLGNVWAWGANANGELGDGTTTGPGGCPQYGPCSQTPVAVHLPSGTVATAIAAGYYHSLALTRRGRVYAWGDNGSGELGDGTTTGPDSCYGSHCSATPVAVDLPSGVRVTAIAAGFDDSLALTSTGQVYAWGGNGYGELGDGTTTYSPTPVAVHLPSGVVATAIAAGYFHSLAVTSTGQVYAWGDNGYGQLGDGTSTGPQSCTFGEACSPTPVAVLLPSKVRAATVAAGNGYSLAVTRLGRAWAWGDNFYGQLGNGTSTGPQTCTVFTNTYPCSPTPVAVLLPSGVKATAIAAGGGQSLALTSTKGVYAWGDNQWGQLGGGASLGTIDSSTPVAVDLPSGVTATAIAAGAYHSLALDP